MTTDWRKDPVFGELADAIASDRLVVYTGSGISNGLVAEGGAPMLSWQALLQKVAAELKPSGQDAKDLETLLEGDPSGADKIEAASILEHTDEAKFTDLVCKRLTPAEAADQPPGEITKQTLRHDAVLGLQPRGIVTLNIDRQHHLALERRGLSWVEIDPTLGDSEAKMRALLSDPESGPFLLEAHGSLAPGSSIVFTHRAYRDLLERNPIFKAFLGNLFINRRFLFLGFGMTDLDFDALLTQTALTFGEPPQHHIAVRHIKLTEEERRREVLYRRRFGVRFLDVPSHPEVWEAVRAASAYCGPVLESSIRLSVSENLAERKAGHRALARLGPAGKAVAIRVITDAIAASPAPPEREFSEYVYSLMHLASGANPPDRRRAKDALFEVLETSSNLEVLAHAITALESYLEVADLPQLEKVSRDVMNRSLDLLPDYPDPDDRLPTYLEAAILRLRATAISDGPSLPPPRPGPPLVRRS